MGVNMDQLPFKWRHESLHDTGYAKYSDHFKGESRGPINFHPTYEAKMWRWLRERDELRFDGTEGFWIVGSAPDKKVVEPFYTIKEA